LKKMKKFKKGKNNFHRGVGVEYLKRPGIFNPSVFSPSYLPATLLFREEQMEKIGRRLSPLLQGDPPAGHLLLFGPAGSGKTAVVQFFLKVLREETKNKGVRLAYCVADGSSYHIATVLAGLLGVTGVGPRGLSFHEVWEKIEREVGEEVLVLVLDELDKHLAREEESSLLYFALSRPRTCVVGISNRANLPGMITDYRISSRFSPYTIYFPHYTTPQLVGILKQRVEEAVKPGVVDPELVEYCALKVMQTWGGNARYALDLLSTSLELVGSSGGQKLTREHVDQALHQLREESIYGFINWLSPPQLALLHVVGSHPGGIEVGKAYEEGGRLLGTRIRPSHYSTFLQGLKELRAVEEVGRGRGRGKGVTWMLYLSKELDPAKVVELTRRRLGI